jgi:hypothetical protein
MKRSLWDGEVTICGRFMVQTEHPRDEPTEYSLMRSERPEGGPPWVPAAFHSHYKRDVRDEAEARLAKLDTTQP